MNKNCSIIPNICKVIAACLTLCFIGMVAISNFRISFDGIKAFLNKETDFSTLTENIAKSFKSDNLSHKTDFIDLNGLYARMTDRIQYNDVTRLKDGMITSLTDELDMSLYASNIAVLSEDLSRKGIRFAFIQAPYKADVEGTLLPIGAEDYSNKNADALLAGLESFGVKTLDLRKYTSTTAEQTEYSFYRTDHHWNPRGAFIGFEYIVSYIKDNFDDMLDITYSDRELWTEHISENCFLGSRGKRVGVFFAGVDDLIYFTPNFDTDMTFSVDKHFIFKRGSFFDTVILDKYIDNRDYHNVNNYCIYIGGDYPLVRHVNPSAPNDKKILIIKDSFTLPVQAFMSTMFSQVDVLDPRHYNDMSIYDYIMCSEPDYVIMLINPSGFLPEMFDFGTEKELVASMSPLHTSDEIRVNAADGQKNMYCEYPFELVSGRTYTLNISEIDVENSSSDAVGIALYSESLKTVVCRRIIDPAQDFPEDSISWTFKVPDNANDYYVIMYAGLPGNTSGNTVVYKNCVLYERTHITHLEQLKLTAKDTQYNYSVVPVDLQNSRSYEIDIAKIKVLEGNTESINICLYDFTTKTRLHQETIEIGENNPYIIILSMPDTVAKSDDCKLLLYSGEAGKTKGISVEYDDIRVTELDY